MPKINSLEVVHQDTNKDGFDNLHDLLVSLKGSANKEVIDGQARAAYETLLEMYANDKEAFAKRLETLTAEFGTSIAQVLEEWTVYASATESYARKIEEVSAKTFDNEARITEEAYARANADEAVAKLVTTLRADFENAQVRSRASLVEEQIARANATEALASRSFVMEASIANANAKITEEQLVRATADSALADDVETLTARLDTGDFATVKTQAAASVSKARVYTQASAPTGGTYVLGDLWIDTDGDNRMYTWNGTSWAFSGTSTTKTFSQASAPTAINNGDLWIDTDDSNKLYRWNGSSWQLQADNRITVISARWGVQVDANGRVAGIQLNSNNTGTSEFTVLAQAFKVYNLSTGTEDPVFTVQGGLVTPRNLNIVSSTGSYILQANIFSSQGVRMWKPGCSVLYADNLADSSLPAIQGWATAGASAGVEGRGYTSNSTNHGLKAYGPSTSGIVGSTIGYDFYADGGGTNYGPFTGAHDALMYKEDIVEIGDLVVDKECIVKRNVSSTLFRVEKSSYANEKAVVGVIVNNGVLLADTIPPAAFDNNNWIVDDFGNYHNEYKSIYDNIKDTHKVYAINALGEGQINVCGENGNIEAGDLIVASSLPGKGMKQSDDIVRSYTVAKAREAITFSSPTEVKQVACIYLCG